MSVNNEAIELIEENKIFSAGGFMNKTALCINFVSKQVVSIYIQSQPVTTSKFSLFMWMGSFLIILSWSLLYFQQLTGRKKFGFDSFGIRFKKVDGLAF
jgi:hypothetical protein